MPPSKKQRTAAGVAGASSAAAAVASSSAATSDAVIPASRRYSLRLNPSQPHQKLHRHALESIFAFLSFGELRSAMFVSKDWLAAVGSMRGLVKGRTLRSQEQISDALASRLARHVTSIKGKYGSVLIKLNRAQVQQITSRVPFLRELSFGLQDDEQWSAKERLSLPATLTNVSIRFDAATSAVSMNSVLVAFSHHESLARLEVIFPEAHSPDQRISFAPLQSLSALMTLRAAQHVRGCGSVTRASAAAARSHTDRIARLSLQ